MDEHKSSDSEEMKYLSLGLMWLGAGIGIGMTNVDSPNLGVFHMIISVMIVCGATVASMVLLGGADFSKSKRKATDGTADAYSNLLLQLMTDEERQTMRKRLINNVANDGELFPANEEQTASQHN